jgi:hypothetical protein
MQIFIPYIGVEMPSIKMTDYGRELGINVDIEYIGRPKIRRSAVASGIPHQRYKVRLFPISEQYRKLRYPFSSGPDAGKARRIYAVCWHGHRDFMVKLFDDFPDATLRSGYLTRGGIEYRGQESFEVTHQDTKADFYQRGVVCKCIPSPMSWESRNHLYA